MVIVVLNSYYFFFLRIFSTLLLIEGRNIRIISLVENPLSFFSAKYRHHKTEKKVMSHTPTYSTTWPDWTGAAFVSYYVYSVPSSPLSFFFLTQVMIT